MPTGKKNARRRQEETSLHKNGLLNSSLRSSMTDHAMFQKSDWSSGPLYMISYLEHNLLQSRLYVKFPWRHTPINSESLWVHPEVALLTLDTAPASGKELWHQVIHELPFIFSETTPRKRPLLWWFSEPLASSSFLILSFHLELTDML